ncbi:MAG: diguanylate cyclase [Gammaproteobacteria bacterium]|nr:diguanylate cyclase [Gammaproteobacteria bacterium]
MPDHLSPPDDPRRLLHLGFGAIILLLFSITAISLLGISRLAHQFDQSIQQLEVKASLASDMRIIGRERSLLLFTMSLTADPFERDRLFLEFRQQGSRFLGLKEEFAALPLDAEERRFLSDLAEQVSAVGRLQYEVIDLLNQDQLQLARDHLMFRTLPLQNQAWQEFDRFAQLQKELSQRQLRLTQDLNQDLTRLILLTCISALILSLLIGYRNSAHIGGFLRALRHSLHREEAIRDNLFAAVITANSRGEILSCNRATEDIFGHPAAELIGRNLACLMPEPLASRHDGFIQHYLHSGEKRVIGVGRDVEGLHRDGHLIPLALGVSEVSVDGERLFIGILQDISLQKQAEQTLIEINERLEQGVRERTRELEDANRLLRHMARHDLVTGLPNRSLLHEHMEKLLHRSLREETLVAVMFLDLDRFKGVNDLLGHEAGDKVLRETGQRIKAAVRDDDLVARIGGDEFAVVCGHLSDSSPIERIAGKIIEAVSQPFFINGNECRIGVSIGISLFPHHAWESEDLLRLADEAMYGIKHGEKNSYAIYLGGDESAAAAPSQD